jgi:hypothetical protein
MGVRQTSSHFESPQEMPMRENLILLQAHQRRTDFASITTLSSARTAGQYASPAPANTTFMSSSSIAKKQVVNVDFGGRRPPMRPIRRAG